MSQQSVNYNLNSVTTEQEQKSSSWASPEEPAVPDVGRPEQADPGFVYIVANSVLNLLSPYIIGHTVDDYIQHGDFHGVLVNAGCCWSSIFFAFATRYLADQADGGYGQRILLPYVIHLL